MRRESRTRLLNRPSRVADPKVPLVLLSEDSGDVLLRGGKSPGKVGRNCLGGFRAVSGIAQRQRHDQVGQNGQSSVGYGPQQRLGDKRVIQAWGHVLQAGVATAQSHIGCHAAYIAFQLGRKLKFDPATDTFIGDDEANNMRSRAMREPWRLT